MYEQKSEPLAPPGVFYRRIFANLLTAFTILAVSLLIGLLGYHYLAGAAWIDALHNASMILSGMGPVVPIETTGGKLFSSAYALFCGIVFITNIGVILAPLIHRLLHRFHVDDAT